MFVVCCATFRYGHFIHVLRSLQSLRKNPFSGTMAAIKQFGSSDVWKQMRQCKDAKVELALVLVRVRWRGVVRILTATLAPSVCVCCVVVVGGANQQTPLSRVLLCAKPVSIHEESVTRAGWNSGGH